MGVSKAPHDCVKWKSKAEMLAKDALAPLCVVIEPTKDLVDQTHNNLILFCKKLSNPSVR